MNEHCLIITTGGTIDKVYFDELSSYAVGSPQIEEVLRQAHVTAHFRVLALMRKDSLELTDADRALLRSAIDNAPEQRVLVTHGTDTMTQTGTFLHGIPNKTIVLTGALLPARFRDNDAIFNIGFAFAAAQTLPTGVFIAINGEIYDPTKVRKDRNLNRFVKVDAPSPA